MHRAPSSSSPPSAPSGSSSPPRFHPRARTSLDDGADQLARAAREAAQLARERAIDWTRRALELLGTHAEVANEVLRSPEGREALAHLADLLNLSLDALSEPLDKVVAIGNRLLEQEAAVAGRFVVGTGKILLGPVGEAIQIGENALEAAAHATHALGEVAEIVDDTVPAVARAREAFQSTLHRLFSGAAHLLTERARLLRRRDPHSSSSDPFTSSASTTSSVSAQGPSPGRDSASPDRHPLPSAPPLPHPTDRGEHAHAHTKHLHTPPHRGGGHPRPTAALPPACRRTLRQARRALRALRSARRRRDCRTIERRLAHTLRACAHSTL